MYLQQVHYKRSWMSLDVLSRFDSWSSLLCVRVCEFMTVTLTVAQRGGPGAGVCVNAKRPVMPGSSMRTGPMRHSSSLPDACYVRLFLPTAPARVLICNKFIQNVQVCIFLSHFDSWLSLQLVSL